MGKCRYIFTMGELKRKDNSLVFKNEKETKYIPLENTREIYCTNEVSVNSKLLGLLNKAGIVVNFFGYHGNYVGSYYPNDHYRSGKLLIKQVEMFQHNRMYVAKKFVYGMTRNVYEVLYHYYRHGNKEMKEVLDFLRVDVVEKIELAQDINQLLFVEGLMWKTFYQSFQHFLPEDFLMNKRVKRPPDNPMNALVSFGNSILYSKVVSSLYYTHLNQEISYLHEPMETRFSLSLDVAEIFKPVIVYKTIFDCVNKKKLKVDKHFDKSLNYCVLNEKGKKIFVKALEERLESTIKHEKLNRKVSYKSLLKYEGYKLIKMMNEGQVYEPFDMKRKC